MSNKPHLTISKEPRGLSTLCPFPLKLNILWMTFSVFWPWSKTAWAATWSSFELPPEPGLSKQMTLSKQQWRWGSLLGHFILLGVLCELSGFHHLCFRQGYRIGVKKVHGRGTWGSVDRRVRSNLQIHYGPFSDPGLGLTLPVTFLHCSSTWNPGWAHGASTPKRTAYADLGRMGNRGWIWLTLAVLAFRLPLRASEISASRNISVPQRRYCPFCIICEKSLLQNLICGSINLKNSSECSICLLDKEQVIAEDSLPYHFVLLSSLWEENKGLRSLFLALSLAKVWQVCFDSISLQK